jgi:hypothetical protein
MCGSASDEHLSAILPYELEAWFPGEQDHHSNANNDVVGWYFLS